VAHSIPKPIALMINYPSNPTALVADLDFYKDVVAFAKKHDIIVLSDLAYSEIYFDGNPPPSVLQVPGAMDVTVEFTSMSKTFSMPGWRMGFAVGNERLIAALTRVKSYLDYGAFTPIQVAATAALNGPTATDIAEMRDVYKAPRRDGRELRPRRLGPSRRRRVDVRLGADPGALPPSRLAGVLQAADREGRCGGGARRRLRRAWRRLSSARLVENEHRIRQAARSSRSSCKARPSSPTTSFRSRRAAERFCSRNTMNDTAPIIVADAGPLIRLAAAGLLDSMRLTNRRVVMVDRVEEEACADRSKPFANEIAEWIARMGDAIEHAVTTEGLGIARRRELARKSPEQEAALRRALRDSGERAIREYIELFRPAEAASALVLYEDSAVPALMAAATVPMTLMSTRAFVRLVAERGYNRDAVKALETIAGQFNLKPPISTTVEPNTIYDEPAT
jgi:hypothetical protein